MQPEKVSVLKKLEEFKIPFKGLSIGIHKFTYEVDHLFFEEIEYSEIKKGRIFVDLNLEKLETMLILNFLISGKVQVKCDRCLEPFKYPISGKQKLIVKFGNNFNEETDEIITIPENEHSLDIAPFIYEYTHLLLPIQCVHPENEYKKGTCNNEIIEKFNKLSKKNQTDPRWDVLKKLKNIC